MEYLLLVLVSLLWSSVGVLVTAASEMVSSNIISLCRFVFGVVFLLIFISASGRKPHLKPCSIWIIAGAFGKSINYIFENIGITMGVSYGNVVVFSLQAVLAYVASIFIFKEKTSMQKGIALILCVSGAVTVSMRNMEWGDFLDKGVIPLIMFAVGALGSAFHLISQKKLVGKTDAYNVNLSTFFIASFITAAPIPFTPTYVGAFSIKACLALLGLGFVTGLSFVFYSKAIKQVSFFTANIITNLSIIFTILWAWVFYNEPIHQKTILGAVIMLSGIILINMQKGGRQNEKS